MFDRIGEVETLFLFIMLENDPVMENVASKKREKHFSVLFFDHLR